MICFLTSSPTGPLDGSRVVDGLDTMNDFRENLRKYWRVNSRCLMIAATPDAYEKNDEMVEFFQQAMLKSGFEIECMDLLDERNMGLLKTDLLSYDVIFLGGGHVPTENAFFHAVELREKIASFDGIVIGISAGSMNSADEVYAQPELEGEAVDPSYQRYLRGLNLTKTQILPHYQMVKDYMLDGMRLFEEITCEDSIDKAFLVLPDGSYLLIADGKEEVYGEAYCFSNKSFFKINENGKVITWNVG